MKPNHAKARIGGFTIVEGVVCVAVLFVLVALLLPLGGSGKAKSKRIACVSNLRQVGFAFRMWANDHGDKLPWDVAATATNGPGTKEFATSGEVWRHFLAISNELATPKVLACSTDRERTRVTDFASLNNNHISYFIGLNADETKPQTILSGDRNLAVSNKLLRGAMTVETNTVLSWTSDLHDNMGNFSLADGSAQQIQPYSLNRQLQSAFLSTTQSVFRFAFPQ